MSNTVTVGFSNDGKSTHYVVDNASLASTLNVGNTLGAAAISANVTGGAIANPYEVEKTQFTGPIDGTAIGAYTTAGSMDEAYKFTANGWNLVKNITVKASGNDSILFIADNFVQADMDFSGVNNDVELRIFDGKRGNYLTGNGDDRIVFTTATNNADWSNLHKISTGGGDDIVSVDKGDASLKGSTIVSNVTGSGTFVEVGWSTPILESRI